MAVVVVADGTKVTCAPLIDRLIVGSLHLSAIGYGLFVYQPKQKLVHKLT